MILKSLSRKSDSSKLIKYIFKEQAAYWQTKTTSRSKNNWYVPGIKLTKQDVQHLESNKEDVGLLRELKEVFKGDIQKFIESKLSGKEAGTSKGQEKPFIIKQNIRARSLEGFCREFKENESGRLYTRSDQISSYHVILSWSPKDAAQITDAMLKDISREYMRLRGDNCMIVGTKHTEKEHIHLHLAVSGTLLNGKSARQSKVDFQKLKQQLQEFQRTKYPFLSNSLPKHGREASKGRGVEKNINPHASGKQALLQCLDEVYKTSTSKEHFISQLESLGHIPYYRAGRFQGIKYNGETKHRIYRYGYDEAKLQALDIQKAKSEKELKDIQDIRNPKTAQRDMTLLYQEAADPKLLDKKREMQQKLVNDRKDYEKTSPLLQTDVDMKEQVLLQELHSLRSRIETARENAPASKETDNEVSKEIAEPEVTGSNDHNDFKNDDHDSQNDPENDELTDDDTPDTKGVWDDPDDSEDTE